MSTLVNEQNFLLAVRETGYRSPAHAIAEFVDNSIQAQSRIVSIDVMSDEHGMTLQIIDDGCGMSPSVMAQALQFGGSTHFDDRLRRSLFLI